MATSEARKLGEIITASSSDEESQAPTWNNVRSSTPKAVLQAPKTVLQTKRAKTATTENCSSALVPIRKPLNEQSGQYGEGIRIFIKGIFNFSFL